MILDSIIGLCVATKTISVDLIAYERLAAARIDPKESFSQVIRRASWEVSAKTCGALLADLPRLPTADEAVLDRLTEAQLHDSPPDDPWA